MDLDEAVEKFRPGIMNPMERKCHGKAAVDDLKERLGAQPEMNRDGKQLHWVSHFVQFGYGALSSCLHSTLNILNCSSPELSQNRQHIASSIFYMKK